MPGNKKETIQVIPSVQRRQRWSTFEKKEIGEETYEVGKSVSYVARKHGIPTCRQLFLWGYKREEGALVAVRHEEKVIPKTASKQALGWIKSRERLLSQKTEEGEIFKEAVCIGREKNLSCQSRVQDREIFNGEDFTSHRSSRVQD